MNKKIILSIVLLIVSTVGLLLFLFDIFTFPFAGLIYPLIFTIGTVLASSGEKDN